MEYGERVYAFAVSVLLIVSRDEEISGMETIRVRIVISGGVEDDDVDVDGIGIVDVCVSVVVDMMVGGKKRFRGRGLYKLSIKGQLPCDCAGYVSRELLPCLEFEPCFFSHQQLGSYRRRDEAF